MKIKKMVLASVLGASIAAPAMAQDVLTGDTRLACEAILCLVTGAPPGECMPSLSRYFSISMEKWSDTLQGRIDFLNMCPAVSMDNKMGSLVNAIANGAGRCNAASLNSGQMVWQGGDSGGYYISNAMPSVCSNLMSHAYTDIKNTVPLYVGLQERNGFWVAPAEYANAVRDYNARIAAEDAAAMSSGGGN